jgi:uncharacterized protein (DUF983 family)
MSFEGKIKRICPRCGEDKLLYIGQIDGKPVALCNDCLEKLL